MKHGIFHGTGKYYYKDGSYYEGDFYKGYFQGIGILKLQGKNTLA